VPSNFITMMLQSMSLSDRLKCALVCKAWAREAAAATRSIILRHRVQDLSCLQRWLEKHGGQVEVLQLHECSDTAVLTALPCPQLHNLLRGDFDGFSLDSRVWRDLAAATKLSSLWLEWVNTAYQQADVVSALTALPDLEQLTWNRVTCGQQCVLSDSKQLQELTKLTSLTLRFVDAAEALEHLGLLTRLQNLSLRVTVDWAEAGCPELQELKALTRLDLEEGFDDIPPSVSQLTALQQLNAPSATPTALNKLSVLTGLTWLRLQYLEDMLCDSPPLQLPVLQDLKVLGCGNMPMSFLANCTQLRVLLLHGVVLSGPGRLVASSMLQQLELYCCKIHAADEAADPVSWQQVFPGPGRLPHLTSLLLIGPDLQHAESQVRFELVVSCCSSLQVLHLDTLPDSITSELARLSGLTSLTLWNASDQQCSSLAQLTGLRELRVYDARKVTAAGLRQLAALEQLTSLGFRSLGWSSDVLREHMSDRLPGPRPDMIYKYAIVNQVCVCASFLFGGGEIAPQSLAPDLPLSVCANTTHACLCTERERHPLAVVASIIALIVSVISGTCHTASLMLAE